MLRVVSRKYTALSFVASYSATRGDGGLLLSTQGPAADAWAEYEALHRKEIELFRGLTS